MFIGTLQTITEHGKQLKCPLTMRQNELRKSDLYIYIYNI